MAADAKTIHHITSWVQQLGHAVPRHPPDSPPSKEKWATLATLLSQDFPTGAFTSASLHNAAQGQDYFPVYEVIRAKLASWWQVNRPHMAHAIDNDPRYDGLDVKEKAWLSRWDAWCARGWQAEQIGERTHRTSLGVFASLLRAHTPKVWDRLNPHEQPLDHNALRDWLARDWDNEEAIFERAYQSRENPAEIIMLHVLVRRYAPQHLHMVPLPADMAGITPTAPIGAALHAA